MSIDKIIVSSADAKYFELLKELFLSLKHNKVLDEYIFGVLNTGMNNEQIDYMKDNNIFFISTSLTLFTK